MKLENDLSELHIKSELSEKGYLKERYDETIDDLTHELTETGKKEIKDILKQKKYQRILLDMVMEQSNKDPKLARDIIQTAMNKLK